MDLDAGGDRDGKVKKRKSKVLKVLYCNWLSFELSLVSSLQPFCMDAIHNLHIPYVI